MEMRSAFSYPATVWTYIRRLNCSFELDRFNYYHAHGMHNMSSSVQRTNDAV